MDTRTILLFMQIRESLPKRQGLPDLHKKLSELQPAHRFGDLTVRILFRISAGTKSSEIAFPAPPLHDTFAGLSCISHPVDRRCFHPFEMEPAGNRDHQHKAKEDPARHSCLAGES